MISSKSQGFNKAALVEDKVKSKICNMTPL